MKRVYPILALLFVQPAAAWATQTHGEPEGLFVHQMAHLFFLFSMGLLIYWLRRRGLTSLKPWRLIQYGAFFFILWNLNTLVSHWLEEQNALLQVRRVGAMQVELITPPSLQWLGMVFYFTKLDHLLCVPALFLLYLGLRRLYQSSPDDAGHGDPSS